MTLPFSKINSGRNQHAAKRLLGEAVSHLLVTDQYSAYKYIDESKRQLCWAHILRNVIAIEESVCPENQKIGEKLALIAHSVFRCHHRYIEEKLTKTQYYRRLRRLRKSWLHWLKLGSYQCSKRYRGRCRNLMSDDAMVWRFMDDPDCPLTNNAAERVLRNYILMRKCCYVTRSYRGDLFRERMFSLIETAKLQQISVKWSTNIGQQWLVDLPQLCELKHWIDYPQFLDKLSQVKKSNKMKLAHFIAQTQQIVINPEALFDVQIKRIHEYKRQLLNLLHVITRYNRILANPEKNWVPRVVIFSGKAASSYSAAKKLFISSTMLLLLLIMTNALIHG